LVRRRARSGASKVGGPGAGGGVAFVARDMIQFARKKMSEAGILPNDCREWVREQEEHHARQQACDD